MEGAAMRTPTRLTATLTAAALGTAALAAGAIAQGPNGPATGSPGAGPGTGTCQAAPSTTTCTKQRQAARQRRNLSRARRGASGRRPARGRRGAGLRQALPVKSAAPLTDVEQTALTYMREEEKLARDVYRAMGKAYPEVLAFTNIAAAEQRHMAAVGTLLKRYGVADPVSGKPAGTYADAGLQKPYDELVAQGAKSRAEALAVGAAIERRDIADLEDRIKQTTKKDLRFVFGHLVRGSQNHLRAFTALAG
jgi:hypothetical protein